MPEMASQTAGLDPEEAKQVANIIEAVTDAGLQIVPASES
jgi:hypothetical protein